MLSFDGPVQAKNALQDLIIERTEAIPDQLREHLRDLLKEPSPVVVACRGAEAVFARSELESDVGDELKDWAAASAVMSEAHGFQTMGLGNRGSRMAKRLRGQALRQAEIPELYVEIANIVAPAPPEPEEPVAEEDGNG